MDKKQLAHLVSKMTSKKKDNTGMVVGLFCCCCVILVVTGLVAYYVSTQSDDTETSSPSTASPSTSSPSTASPSTSSPSTTAPPISCVPDAGYGEFGECFPTYVGCEDNPDNPCTKWIRVRSRLSTVSPECPEMDENMREDCPAVDCEWGSWSDWSPCEYGQRERTRVIITESSNGGAPCRGPYRETDVCEAPPVEGNAEWVEIENQAWPYAAKTTGQWGYSMQYPKVEDCKIECEIDPTCAATYYEEWYGESVCNFYDVSVPLEQRTVGRLALEPDIYKMFIKPA